MHSLKYFFLLLQSLHAVCVYHAFLPHRCIHHLLNFWQMVLALIICKIATKGAEKIKDSYLELA